VSEHRKPAEEYVVIRHRPGYRLRRSLILLTFSILAAVLGYVTGMAQGGFRFSTAEESRDLLEEQGPQPWEKVVDLMGQMAEALDYAHSKGVLHRDFKPANVLLAPETGAVLTDFGFARILSDNSMTMTLSGGVVGTPAYIAPEVWDGQEAGPGVDIYALGCILYELVTGQPLFQGKTVPAVMRAHFKPRKFPEQWPEGVPQGLAELLLLFFPMEILCLVKTR